MANHPPHPASFSFNPPLRTSTTMTNNPTISKDRKVATTEQLILDILSPDLRENAISELLKKRAQLYDLAPLLWNSYGTISVLLQDIIRVYPSLSPPNISRSEATHISNALALFQSVASHPETRKPFVKALIPLYLYPFLNNTNSTTPFEYLRLASLGVIGSLVRADDSDIVEFLLSSEVVPLCLHSMKFGSVVSKTGGYSFSPFAQVGTRENYSFGEVATFVVQKIIQSELGLLYICHPQERFFALCECLQSMLKSMPDHPPYSRLLKYIVLCYHRLADHSRLCRINCRARGALRTRLPQVLLDGTFNSCLHEDPTIGDKLNELVVKVLETSPVPTFQTGGLDHMRVKNPSRML